MVSKEVMYHQTLAAFAWEKGRYRECADEYWKSFIGFTNRTHEMRYYTLHGYTSTLRGRHFHATETDFKNMLSILNDKHEPRLFRAEAGFTLGLMYYDKGERQKCADTYRRAIAIGEKKPDTEKDARKEETCLLALPNPTAKKTMKEILDDVVIQVKKNLDRLNHITRDASGTVIDTDNKSTLRHLRHQFYIGLGGTTLTDSELNNLIDVGGSHCDYCKAKDKPLMKCSRCKRGFYCSKECQRNQWVVKEHKKYCRKEGQFEAGDLVQINCLKNRPELNGCILRVVGPNTASEGRYKLMIEGGVTGDNVLSIKAENMNHLRPYDCRN